MSSSGITAWWRRIRVYGISRLAVRYLKALVGVGLLQFFLFVVISHFFFTSLKRPLPP